MTHNHDREIPSYILDDLSTRFLNNLPEQEYADLVRVFFQVEQAYWFFLDFYCNKSGIKAIAIKDFSEQIFRHCPVLVDHYGSYEDILRSWREYKLTVPRYGVIILDPSMEQCLLVRGMSAHSSWTFPKGKINEGESEVDCAIRETEEEIGYDTSDSIDQYRFLEHKMNDQYNKLYIVRDVPLDTVFQTKTRNEIRSIKWWAIDALPAEHGNNHFLFVYPFVKKLRNWIESQKKGGGKKYRQTSLTERRTQRRNAANRPQQMSSSVGVNPTRERRERKYATPIVSGIGRGRNPPRYSLLANAGSENDDDVIVKPYQPFAQVSRRSNNYKEASPVAVRSLFAGEPSKRRSAKQHNRPRNSLSGGTSNDGGDEAVTASKPAPIAISCSALGLAVADEIIGAKPEKQSQSDADVETDAQPHDPLSNEDEAAEESDDEAEATDESGDVGGFSADDGRSAKRPPDSASSPEATKAAEGSWQNFIPECWRKFSFDRSLIFDAWDGAN